jgi:hypothetical protein
MKLGRVLYFFVETCKQSSLNNWEECIPWGSVINTYKLLVHATPSLNVSHPESMSVREIQFSRDKHLGTEGTALQQAQYKRCHTLAWVMEDWVYYSLSITICHRKAGDQASPSAGPNGAVATTWPSPLASLDNLQHWANYPRCPVLVRPVFTIYLLPSFPVIFVVTP